MSTNMSKYPEIIVDKDKNAVNTNLKVDLTVEQLYDLFHHLTFLHINHILLYQ